MRENRPSGSMSGGVETGVGGSWGMVSVLRPAMPEAQQNDRTAPPLDSARAVKKGDAPQQVQFLPGQLGRSSR
jgi:hypothetical protein